MDCLNTCDDGGGWVVVAGTGIITPNRFGRRLVCGEEVVVGVGQGGQGRRRDIRDFPPSDRGSGNWKDLGRRLKK